MSGRAVSTEQPNQTLCIVGVGTVCSAIMGGGMAPLYSIPVAAGIVCGGTLFPVAILTAGAIVTQFPTEDSCRKAMCLVLGIIAGIAVGFAPLALFNFSITFIEVATLDLTIIAGAAGMRWALC
ncbi:MAG: hypothetical protein ACHQT8_04455 [Chlamydiales bacterium]